MRDTFSDLELRYCEEHEGTCENGGSCVSLTDEEGEYKCICTEEFKGKNCETSKKVEKQWESQTFANLGISAETRVRCGKQHRQANPNGRKTYYNHDNPDHTDENREANFGATSHNGGQAGEENHNHVRA